MRTLLPVLDTFERPLRSLRISVTDRCNLRCRYCMPNDEYVWLPRSSVLSFEEIERLAGLFVGLGVSKLRVTGGEPLLRHDLPVLVARLAAVPGLDDLAMTTNAVLLARHASSLRQSGLGRLTVSLDTLRAERYARDTKADRLDDALRGVEAAQAEGFTGTRMNAVIVRGVNDDEIIDLFEFGAARGIEVRFIEYMDVGGATSWSMEAVVSQAQILGAMGQRYGAIESLHQSGDVSMPANQFRLSDGRMFGIVASTTQPFCRTCDRARLTADGMFYLCLYTDSGVDLRGPLRDGASDRELTELIRGTWQLRTDRGAEERHGMSSRSPLHQLAGLRSDPHREMHTRGG